MEAAVVAPAPAGPYAKTSTLDFYRLNYTIPSNESYYQWIRADQFGQTHPEYFPVFQGKRFIPKMNEKGVTAAAKSEADASAISIKPTK